MSTPRPLASLLVLCRADARLGCASALDPRRRRRRRPRVGQRRRREAVTGDTVTSTSLPERRAGHLADDASGGLPAERQQGAGHRLRDPARQGRAAPPSARGALRVHEGLPRLAGQLVLRSASPAGAAPGLRRRRRPARSPRLDRLSGRLDDGPRLSRRLRPQRQRTGSSGSRSACCSWRRSFPGAVGRRCCIWIC